MKKQLIVGNGGLSWAKYLCASLLSVSHCLLKLSHFCSYEANKANEACHNDIRRLLTLQGKEAELFIACY